jgi:PadR family transcriptional regulator PadR
MVVKKSNFKKGSVEMLILTLLNDQTMYGYQISQEISGRSGNIINIPEGSLYPTLYKLLEENYVADERRLVGKRMSRIYYSITDKGRERLQDLYRDYTLVHKGIKGIMENSGFALDEAAEKETDDETN